MACNLSHCNSISYISGRWKGDFKTLRNEAQFRFRQTLAASRTRADDPVIRSRKCLTICHTDAFADQVDQPLILFQNL